MRLPGWWPASQATVRRLRQQLDRAARAADDADSRAANAVRTCESLREQLTLSRSRHAATLGRVRGLLANVETYTHGRRLDVAASVDVKFVADLQKALDGYPLPTGSVSDATEPEAGRG